MAQITSTIDITTITALATEGQRDKDLRRQAYWSRLLADTMCHADAGKRSAVMQAIIRHLTVTLAL